MRPSGSTHGSTQAGKRARPLYCVTAVKREPRSHQRQTKARTGNLSLWQGPRKSCIAALPGEGTGPAPTTGGSSRLGHMHTMRAESVEDVIRCMLRRSRCVSLTIGAPSDTWRLQVSTKEPATAVVAPRPVRLSGAGASSGTVSSATSATCSFLALRTARWPASEVVDALCNDELVLWMYAGLNTI